MEDSEDAAKLLQSYLEEYQHIVGDAFCVTLFPNAVSFLEPYRGHDLIFMDIQMRHMDGMEAALRLRK